MRMRSGSEMPLDAAKVFQEIPNWAANETMVSPGATPVMEDLEVVEGDGAQQPACNRHGAEVDHNGNDRVAEDVPFTVEFRELSDQQLDHYLRVEQPYQCAGSFKAEGYGACLFSRMHGDDPSALIGLPLLRLTQMLEAAGIEVV